MTTAQPRAGASNRATTYAWITLCGITLLSWWMAPAHAGGAAASIPITLAVVAFGAVKGRLIVRYFMEVRSAPRWLRTATDAWLVVLWTAVVVVYLW